MNHCPSLCLTETSRRVQNTSRTGARIRMRLATIWARFPCSAYLGRDMFVSPRYLLQRKNEHQRQNRVRTDGKADSQNTRVSHKVLHPPLTQKGFSGHVVWFQSTLTYTQSHPAHRSCTKLVTLSSTTRMCISLTPVVLSLSS